MLQGVVAVLLNDLILYRSRSGIAGYTRELLAHLPLVEPDLELKRLSETLPGKLLRRVSGWMGGGNGTPDGRKSAWKSLAKSGGHLALDSYSKVAFRLTRWRLYHEPDLIPLSIRAPTVVTAHDLSVLLFPSWHPEYRVKKFEQNLERALDRIELFLAVSECTKRDLVRLLGVPAEKIRVIPEAPRREFRPTGEARENFLLCVGTIEPRKNVAGLLRAYVTLPPAFRKRHPLWLAGTWGWKSNDVRELLQREPWKSEVRYLGFVEDERLVSLISRARVVVYPSYYEGFGLPPLEAMACGAPVITTHGGALKEVVGDAAKIVEPDDEKALAGALREVVEDEALAAQLVKKGSERLLRFDWLRTAQLTLEAYRSLG